MGFCAKPIPAVYDDSLSFYEMYCKLSNKLNELVELINSQESTYATIEMLENSQSEQDRKWGESLSNSVDSINAYISSEVTRLEKLIEDAIAGQVTIFDPTYGISPRYVGDVVKNVYHWLRYYADYAKVIDDLELSAQDRDSLSLTSKEFDLYSMRYYSKSDNVSPLPDNYVKKHDIKAYYFERMLNAR